MNRIIAIICVGLFLLLRSVAAANAHPHVWVTIHSEIVYTPEGLMTGVRHAWTFDDMFSAFAVQGIQSAKQGEYTRDELGSLAEVNVTSLKEFNYFTYAKANGKKAKFADPVDYWLEYKDSALTLHFTLPLKAPVSAKTTLIEVYDPTFFVSFEMNKDKPIALVGAPQGCKLVVEVPREPTPEQLRLSQLEENPLAPSDKYGDIFANKLQVKCP